jgi:hypothetical protein
LKWALWCLIISAGAIIVLSVRIEGATNVKISLDKVGASLPAALNRGLSKVAVGIYREAFDRLSGSGSKESRKRGVKGSSAGSYPVPVVTNNLRSRLDWLKPGESKSGAAGTFTAGDNEVVIFDSAAYADPIHEGTYSSSKFGKRPFLTDA